MFAVKYHIPYGIGCILLIPEIIGFILPARRDRLKRIAEMFGVNTRGLTMRKAAELAIKAVSHLMDDVAIPSLVEATGATTDDIPMLAELALKEVWSTPRPVTVKRTKKYLE